MENFISYLIESSIILGILTIFYRFVLHHEPLFRFNRFFLLFSLLVAATLPFVHITSLSSDMETTQFSVLLDSINVFAGDMRDMVVPAITDSPSFTSLYWLGAFYIATRLLWGIIYLGRLSRKATWHKYKGIRIADLQGQLNPFSFFHIIFINRSLYSDDDLNKILVHEKAHIQHKHSLDVLLFEMTLIVQWFNPFAWLIKILLKELHEFQADHSVIQSGTPVGSYKKLLLCQATGAQLLPVNNFNQSITKKRFKMMTHKILKNKALTKTIVAVCMITGVAFFFACDNQLSTDLENQEEILNLKSTTNSHSFLLGDSTQVYFVVDSMPKYPGGDLELRKYIAQNVQYPEYAAEHKIQGRVYVSFIIDEEGYVTEVDTARGIHPSINEEALRVVNSMPQWTPGTYKGKAVKVSYTIPINFVLQSSVDHEKDTSEAKIKNTKHQIFFVDGKKITKAEMQKIPKDNIASINVLKGESAIQKYGEQAKDGAIFIQLKDTNDNNEAQENLEGIYLVGDPD